MFHLLIQLRAAQVVTRSDPEAMSDGNRSTIPVTKRKTRATRIAAEAAPNDKAIGEVAGVLAQEGMTGGDGRNELGDPLTVVRKNLHRQRRILSVFV